jgi:hypothetical protein
MQAHPPTGHADKYQGPIEQNSDQARGMTLHTFLILNESHVPPGSVERTGRHTGFYLFARFNAPELMSNHDTVRIIAVERFTACAKHRPATWHTTE